MITIAGHANDHIPTIGHLNASLFFKRTDTPDGANCYGSTMKLFKITEILKNCLYIFNGINCSYLKVAFQSVLC